jgi:hypothetical protein
VNSLSNESVAGEQTATGGVMSLLKMVKAQCAVAVVIAVLRGPNGARAVTVFPELSDEPTARKPIRKLVEQLWEEPLPAAGQVAVQGVRLPKGFSATVGRHAVMAVATVSPGQPDQPDVLCLVGPVSGSFDGQQLDTVRTLATRLASYQQARGALAPGVETPARQGLVMGDENPVIFTPTSSMPPPPQTIPPQPVPEAAGTSTSEADHSTPTPGRARTLDTLFGPDPLTGLAGLPSLLARLGQSLGALPLTGGRVGLVLVRVTTAVGEGLPPDTQINAVADALVGHVRADDRVSRLDEATFGVVTALSPGSCAVSVIEQRLFDAVAAGVEASFSGLDLQTASVAIDADQALGAEDVVRQVMSELGDP